MKLKLAKSVLVFSFIVPAFWLYGCKGPRENVEGTPNLVSNTTINAFSESVADQAGIIGEPSFILEEPTSSLKKAWDATGIISLKGSKGNRGSIGNGIFVRKKEDGKLYVLTAKHVIYDIKTLALKSQHGYFGYDLENRKSVFLKLDALPVKLDGFDPQDDKILIPVDELDVVAFQYQHRLVTKADIPKIESANLSTLYSVGVKVQNRHVYKFYQSNFVLQYHEIGIIKLPLIRSDVDALPGLSGSPIFKKDDRGELKLVGILVKGSKQTQCKKYLQYFCQSTVLLLGI